MGPSQIAPLPIWCSKLRLTTGVKKASCNDEFREPRSDTVDQKDNLVALHFKYDFWQRTATADSDVVQSGSPIFDDFFQPLWPSIGNNTTNVVFQMVKRLWLIHIDQ
ncbi:adhesion G protein-coupled receptor B2 [Trichonephila clavipes]|nr:adhesion G protein-coupled receptor B2 [Trichonephila clavipes]